MPLWLHTARVTEKMPKKLGVVLILQLLMLTVGGVHDSWGRTGYPLEEWTTGIEVGPDETPWGRLATVSFRTSRREFAESTGAVYITFYGRRATSEIHLLQVMLFLAVIGNAFAGQHLELNLLPHSLLPFAKPQKSM